MVGQLGSRFDRDERPFVRRAEDELVEQRTEVALARTAIDDQRLRIAGHRVVERGCEQTDEVPDLLQLAAGICVEMAVAGQEVELLEELIDIPLGTSDRARVVHGGTVAFIAPARLSGCRIREQASA